MNKVYFNHISNNATKQYITNDGSNTNPVTAFPPVTNAGPKQLLQSFQIVQLNNSASSDPSEFTPLTYNWTQTRGLLVNLTVM